MIPRLLAVAILVLLPGASALAAPDDAIPDDADWALVAAHAGRGAETARALAGVADSRGLQQGFAAALRAGVGWDPFDPAALDAAGVDASAPLAVYARAGVQLLALRLREGGSGEAHLAAWLRSVGEPRSAPAHRGWEILVVEQAGSAVAAAAREGREVITARVAERGADLLASLRRSIDAAAGVRPLARAALVRSVRNATPAPWHLWIAHPDGALATAVDLRGSRLVLEGRLRHPSAAELGRSQAFPGLASDGQDLLVARLHLSPAARPSVAQGIRFLLARACAPCPPAARESHARAVAELLSGPVALAVRRVEPLALGDRRFDPTAMPFAWVASVRDAAAASRRLAAIAHALGVAGTSDHAIDVDGGTLHFGLRGDRLYVASDAELRDRLLAATAGAASAPGAPLQATIAPARIAESLARLTLADAMRGGPLAQLFALRLQLGPLLQASGPLHLEATPAGDTLRFSAAWELRAAP